MRTESEREKWELWKEQATIWKCSTENHYKSVGLFQNIFIAFYSSAESPLTSLAGINFVDWTMNQELMFKLSTSQTLWSKPISSVIKKFK